MSASNADRSLSCLLSFSLGTNRMGMYPLYFPFDRRVTLSTPWIRERKPMRFKLQSSRIWCLPLFKSSRNEGWGAPGASRNMERHPRLATPSIIFSNFLLPIRKTAHIASLP